MRESKKVLSIDPTNEAVDMAFWGKKREDAMGIEHTQAPFDEADIYSVMMVRNNLRSPIIQHVNTPKTTHSTPLTPRKSYKHL